MKLRFDPFHVSGADKTALRRLVRAGTTPQRAARRAHIVLLAAAGWPDRAIAARLLVTPKTVRLWLGRYRTAGIEGLLRDAPGRGRRRSATASVHVARIRALLTAPPPEGTRWTVRRLAAAAGISRASADRIVRALGRVPQDL